MECHIELQPCWQWFCCCCLAADSGAYHQGLNLGLLDWCTEQRGYDMAVNGETPTAACSRTTHRNYHRGYRNGLSELERLRTIDELKLEKLAILENQAQWKQRVAEIDAALASVEIPDYAKRRLRSEKLKLEKQLLDSDIRLEQIDQELAQIGG